MPQQTPIASWISKSEAIELGMLLKYSGPCTVHYHCGVGTPRTALTVFYMTFIVSTNWRSHPNISLCYDPDSVHLRNIGFITMSDSLEFKKYCDILYRQTSSCICMPPLYFYHGG